MNSMEFFMICRFHWFSKRVRRMSLIVKNLKNLRARQGNYFYFQF